ncbi:MAG TPA: hypothetical protein VF228_13080 [Iamia sp.]
MPSRSPDRTRPRIAAGYWLTVLVALLLFLAAPVVGWLVAAAEDPGDPGDPDHPRASGVLGVMVWTAAFMVLMLVVAVVAPILGWIAARLDGRTIARTGRPARGPDGAALRAARDTAATRHR